MVLTILTMFSFSVHPHVSWTSWACGRSGPKNKVVVKTAKFGNLKESNLELSPQRPAESPRGDDHSDGDCQESPPQTARQYFEREVRPGHRGSLVNSWLLAHYAQQLGIVLSDDAINSFLEAETEDRVTSEEMQEVFQHAGLSAGQFFSLLRQELLALKVQELFRAQLAGGHARPSDGTTSTASTATPPSRRSPFPWPTTWARLPTRPRRNSKTFFEENKEQIAMPDSPEPGFHQPQRIALEYVKADIEKFADPKTITDQQVRERYEKDKDKYDKLVELEKRLHPRSRPPRRRRSRPSRRRRSRRAADEVPGTVQTARPPPKPAGQPPQANRAADRQRPNRPNAPRLRSQEGRRKGRTPRDRSVGASGGPRLPSG